MIQNFLPLRLSSGFIDGGVFVMPTDFDGTQVNAQLVDGIGYVDVSFHYSPLANTFRPFAEVPVADERTKAYQRIPGYLDMSYATKEGPIMSWNANWYSMITKDENTTLIEQAVVGQFGVDVDPTTAVSLPLDFDDTDLLWAEYQAYLAEGYVPEIGENLDFANLEYVPGTAMGSTFTMLEVDDIRFIYEQSSPSNVWTIQHDLGQFPLVEVKENGSALLGVVHHLDADSLTVTFGVPRYGEARIGLTQPV